MASTNNVQQPCPPMYGQTPAPQQQQPYPPMYGQQQQQQQQQYYPPMYGQQPPQPQQQYYPPMYGQQPVPHQYHTTTGPIMEPNHPRVLAKPYGSQMTYDGDSKKGKVLLKIISGHNLVSADLLSGKSDPFCKIRSYSISSLSTNVIDENLNPVWDQTFGLFIRNVDHEILVIEVIDYDSLGKNDPLGYFAINISTLPRGIEITTRENLLETKHGQVEITIKAEDFGLINVPPNYVSDYIKYRQEILVTKTKDEISKLIKAHEREVKKKLPITSNGPFVDGYPPKGYKLKSGWLKKDSKTHTNSKPYNGLGNDGKEIFSKVRVVTSNVKSNSNSVAGEVVGDVVFSFFD
ncbi:hypothetical protein CYY_003718 [Polysphondylium violaceum]|uniref:C2 domain-containing protein n=1 Tax=Polysphondylium violaceum TaxID=133409 RepID=A0A8J4PZA1_9MYCE|nr:hypothetical protein CYY_003718 [Polysphondylium violaceum]